MTEGWRGARTGRLALRLYAASLGVVLAVAVALALVVPLVHKPPTGRALHPPVRYVAARLAGAFGDRRALEAEVRLAAQHLGGGIAVHALHGAPLASSSGAGPRPLSADLQARLARDRIVMTERPGLFAAALPLTGPLRGYAMIDLPPPRFGANPALVTTAVVLVLLALVAVVGARVLARPLTMLASAARDLGAGKLDARVRFTRRDEFGEVGRAFDEMADRITALIRAQKDLLANASHELRTPLARIRVALDLAADGNAAAAQEAFQDIREDLIELERMVEDVLTAARLDALAGTPLRLADVPVQALVEKVRQRFAASHPDRRLELLVATPPLIIRADPILLRRALDNLLDNAGKFSEPGSAVSLRVGAQGEALELSVEDHGIGIETEDLDRLFTPFFRTDRSRSRATGGIGLGLTLVKRIVEAHGGSVSVASEVGKGTTVRVRIPAGASGFGNVVPGTPPDAPGTFERKVTSR